MQKRGATQLDWAISLAIFVLFIAWFFIFVQPNLMQSYHRQTLMVMVKNNFERDYQIELQKLPIFISSSDHSEYTPVIMNFSYDWDSFIFEEGIDYANENNSLLFLANVSSGNSVNWLIRGINYTMSNQPYGLIVAPSWITTSSNLSVYFEESLLDEAYYQGRIRLNTSHYYINSIEYSPVNYTYTDYKLVGAYKATSYSINHTIYVFARNSQIHNYVSVSDVQNNYAYTISFRPLDYQIYYTNNNYYGFLNVSKSTNTNYTADYISFYDQEDAMSLFFDRNVTIGLLYYNNTVYLNISFDVGEKANYLISFHDGDYSDAAREPQRIRSGIIEKTQGYNIDDIELINYTYVKAKWRYPASREFVISVFNTTKLNESELLIRIGQMPKRYTIRYAEEDNSVLVSPEGEITPIRINYLVW